MSEVIRMVAKCNIFDGDRGIGLYRGMYVEAPADFFQKYGKSFEKPTKPFDAKKHRLYRIKNWEAIKKAMEPVAIEAEEEGNKGPATSKGQPRKGMSTKEAAVPEDEKTKEERTEGEKMSGKTETSAEKDKEEKPKAASRKRRANKKE